jgi:N6-L-threonylcarbamoyladenine synthase
LVGLSAAKSLAFTLGKPLIGVDHVIAHVYSGFLTDPKLRFPCLGLVVSGGHTMTLRMDGPSKVRVIGKTIDDASGEAFDKVAKMLGLGYPGGPEIDRLAKGRDPKKIPFKRPYLTSESPDFSFSGIKTAAYYLIEGLKKKNKKLTPEIKKDICAGFQEAVCDVLVKKSVDAAKKEGLKSIVVGGGVSANSRLRSQLIRAAKQEGIRAVFPSMPLCQDNAAMIAALGEALHREGRVDPLDMQSYPEFQFN